MAKKKLNPEQQKLIKDNAHQLLENFNNMLAENGLNEFKVNSFSVIHSSNTRCCDPDEIPVIIVKPNGDFYWSCNQCGN